MSSRPGTNSLVTTFLTIKLVHKYTAAGFEADAFLCDGFRALSQQGGTHAKQHK